MTIGLDDQPAAPNEPEYEPMPHSRRPRGLGAVALAMAVLFVAVLGVGGLWATKQMNGRGGGAAVSVEIPPGSSTTAIASLLQRNGVIGSATLFRYYLRFKGGSQFQAGAYTLRRHESFDSVISTLHRGPKLTFERLTIPEGLTLQQIADRVGKLPGRSAQVFMQVATSGEVRSQYEPAGSTNLEGLLYPDTYQFEPKDDERAILTRMVNGFDTVAAELGLDQAPAKVGLSPYEVLILASMIEREARVPDDRPMIARVVYNRLKTGTPLGIDATLRYAIGRPSEPLRQSDLAKETPYNTRLNKGLPPTPIASPGRSSLQAAIDPAPGPWLFYVLSDADGHHVFSTTAAEFERDVAACRAKGLGC